MPGLRKTQVRKAARMLAQAIEMLEACGSKAAIKHGRRALAAVNAEVQKEQARQAETAMARPQPVRVMPRDQTALIRGDGTLRYVSFMKSAGRRPEVIAVMFRAPGLPALMTSFTLVNRDFDAVYEAAVRALAQHIGVIDNGPVVEAMLSTRIAFQKRYGLNTVEHSR